MPAKRRALVINADDNVAVALEDIAAATVSIVGYPEIEIAALRPIPFGHKIAIHAITKGEPILKYGLPIAFALADIPLGDWIHEHNAKSYFAAKREGELRERDPGISKT